MIHTLDLMKTVYVNVFSCKEFDTDEATTFVVDWFDAKDCIANVITRH